jgi:hypothetical protein
MIAPLATQDRQPSAVAEPFDRDGSRNVADGIVMTHYTSGEAAPNGAISPAYLTTHGEYDRP